MDLFIRFVCIVFFHVLFIYLLLLFILVLFWIFLYCFCFCLGLAVNFDLTGFTKSIYFRTRFVCTSWASIQSVRYDRFVYLQINHDQRVFV